MTKIVEIVGPPGVGKSTILGHLDGWPKPRAWSTLRSLRSQRPSLFDRLRVLRQRKGNAKRQANVPHVAPFDRFIEDHPDYVDLVWKHISRYRGPDSSGRDLRFFTATNFFRSFSKHQELKERPVGGVARPDQREHDIILLDEHLVQKATVLCGPNCDSETIRRVMTPTPKPDGAVFLSATPEIVAHRAWTRSKTARGHEGLTREGLLKRCEHTLLQLNCILDELENQGIPVLRIDTGARDAGSVVAEIAAFLDSLEANGVR